MIEEFTIADLKLTPTTYLGGTSPKTRSWDILDINRGIVLGIFRRDSEGYNLEFSGDRPFTYRDWTLLMKFAEVSQRLLEITISVEEMEEEYE